MPCQSIGRSLTMSCSDEKTSGVLTASRAITPNIPIDGAISPKELIVILVELAASFSEINFTTIRLILFLWMNTSSA